MKEKKYCRCCKKKELIKYLNLGKQPLANSYHKGEKLSKYELSVNLCTSCFHSQLTIVVSPETMFKNYLYVSGTTKTFHNHTKELAKDAVSRIKDVSKINVLDIACNDGTQLEYFRELGCYVLGVDPAENLRPITESKKIPVLVNYWKPKVAQLINKKFHIITGTNVFAHVDNLDEFLEASKIALHKNGLLILEFPYADKMIERNEFDTIYHEHLSYFLVNSFATLMTRVGMQIVDVKQTPIHGGSIRFFVKNIRGKHALIVEQLIAKEKENGLLEKKSYTKFSNAVKKNKTDMRDLIEKLQSSGKKVIGYAASAKGNTMLNYFKIKPDYIVDDNNLKWGYFTPGMNIQILPPQRISEEKSDLYVVIMAWNFYNEIASRILRQRPRKNDFGILYVPEVKKVSLKNQKNLSISA